MNTGEVRFGRQKTIKSTIGPSVTIKSDGRVGPDECRGAVRVDGFVSSIQDERVTTFIKQQDASVFGTHWNQRDSAIPGRYTADSGDEVAGFWGGGTQQLTVDTESRRVILNTKGVDGEHKITAGYNARTGSINPRTITEEFESRSLANDSFEGHWGR